jgi:hypothetical protein
MKEGERKTEQAWVGGCVEPTVEDGGRLFDRLQLSELALLGRRNEHEQK